MIAASNSKEGRPIFASRVKPVCLDFKVPEDPSIGQSDKTVSTIWFGASSSTAPRTSPYFLARIAACHFDGKVLSDSRNPDL